MLTIRDAAAAIGVHPNTLKRWADAGLVPVTKLPSGYRRWTTEQVAQITSEMERPATVGSK